MDTLALAGDNISVVTLPGTSCRYCLSHDGQSANEVRVVK